MPFSPEEIIEIKEEALEKLKLLARQSPLKRERICLHRNHADQVQEMVIAFCRESYVRPHRHLNKSESFHIIEGELDVIFFDEKGAVIKKIHMGEFGSGKVFIYRLNSSPWHTVIPFSEYAILHETTTGPFIKYEEDFPIWAPDKDDVEGITKFLERIKTEGA